VIPTPFYRYPFEFTVGFRQTFPLHLFAYFLCFMSVWVGNFNLGIFALLLSILLCCQYYGEPENSYYVWIFAFTPQAFIWHKLKIAFAYANLVAAPISLSLLFCFPANFLLVLGLQLLAIVYLVAVILAKYAVFPHRINIAQAILLTISFAFPPFLLGVIPFFYRKSIHQLKANLS
ncbi:MAG: ABC transporter permease, partial [Saprospiraceae bacterium]